MSPSRVCGQNETLAPNIIMEKMMYWPNGIRAFLILVILATVAPARGYEITTHAGLTKRAYEQSVLVADPTLLQELDL